MPNDILVSQLENLLNELVTIGGQREVTTLVPSLTVVDAAPAGLTSYVIIEDSRDGDYIPALKVPGVLYANNDLVNVLFVEGTEPIAFQQASQSSGSAIAVSKLVSPDEAINPVFSADNSGHSTAANDVSADNFAFIVKNTSGATANASDVGYIDEAGEYKTTTTANNDVDWAVVIQGGANNADIYVARRGRVTVAYTGTAPSVGDFLVTSTVAGDAQTQTAMRPEIFAVCLAAGSGGVVEALLLCQRKYIPFNNADNVLRLTGTSDSDFVAVIAAAGVSGDKVYHDPPSSGTVDAISPVLTTELGKLVLHNTTQVEEAFIIATGTDATDDFIQVSDSTDISGWVATDAIEVRSQTNTSTPSAGVYFFDLDLAENNSVPILTTFFQFALQLWVDSGAVGEQLILHPFEANETAKKQRSETVSTTESTGLNLSMPLINRRFCISYTASGVGTANLVLRGRGVVIASP